VNVKISQSIQQIGFLVITVAQVANFGVAGRQGKEDASIGARGSKAVQMGGGLRTGQPTVGKIIV
jgi:hypothetical protein